MDYYEAKLTEAKATDIRAARKVFSRVGFAFFVLAVIYLLTQRAVMYAVNWAFPGGLNSSLLIYAAVLLPMYLVATPVCLVFLRRVEPRPMKQKSITFGYFLALLLMCIPIIYLGMYLGVKVTSLIDEYTGYNSSESLNKLIIGSDLLSNFIFLGLLAPIIEEILFRKLLIDRIVKYGEGIAVFTSALMFGLFHGNFTQFFFAFGVGLLFAYIYCRTGKIRYSIALHMIINMVNSVFIPFIISKIDMNAVLRLLRMKEDNPNSTAITEAAMPGLLVLGLLAGSLLLLGIIGLVLLIITRKRFVLEKAEFPIPGGKHLLTVWMNFGMFLFVVACVGLFAHNMLLN